MTPREAIMTVLRDADSPLHWTVIQDRALREGWLDPFVIRDVRAAVLGALRDLAAEGLVERVSTGTWRLVTGP
jgi:hypothetical protein